MYFIFLSSNCFCSIFSIHWFYFYLCIILTFIIIIIKNCVYCYKYDSINMMICDVFYYYASMTI
jgi:hypothetical protein